MTVFLAVSVRSVFECESVMKGLYGMLGLEYQDEDSEEEGGSSFREPRDFIQITDDEEAGEKKSACDNDIVVVDLGGKNKRRNTRKCYCWTLFSKKYS